MFGKCLIMNPKSIIMNRRVSNVDFFTILVIVCESFRELDGSKAPDDLSSYAVRLLNETFVVFLV